MDRKALRLLTHKADRFLTVDNINYRQWVFRYTFLELEKDLGARGDITTRSVFKENFAAVGRIEAREKGVLAGLEEIKYFLMDSAPQFKPQLDGEFEIKFNYKDGDVVEKGATILEIKAGVWDLLAVERCVLNLLMRMSGVASYTSEIVDQIKDYDVLIVPTRKTLWGLLDKKAVVIGGGGTHRLNLNDAVLVKDTHLDLLYRDFEKVVDSVIGTAEDVRFLEIEVENVEEVLKVAALFEKHLQAGEQFVPVILLDNLGVAEVSEAIEGVKSKGFHDDILFEASGGITEENVVEYAKIGVDIISMGCLTNYVGVMDMGMKIV